MEFDRQTEKKPDITIDWSGGIFLGIHLDWDYTKLNVNLSIHNYAKNLSIFQHKKPKHHQHSPNPDATPNYGANI